MRGDRYYDYDGLTGEGLSIRREPAVVAEDRAPDSRAALTEMDYTEYLRRSSVEGTVGPVPVLYLALLYKNKR